MSKRMYLCRLIIILCLFGMPAWSNAAISVVDSFDPNANATIKAIAYQPDGKILVCGYFTTLSGQTRNHIGRLNADGSLDATFNPSVTGDIYTLAVQPDGKILVGGYFTALGGQPRNNIGRVNANGTIDTTFNPGANSEVFAITVQPDGKIIVGGWFGELGGQTRNNIGRLNADGSLDSTFNSGAGREIYSIALQSDGKILVGGAFTTLGGQTRNRIGRLNANGSLDTAFNPGANGTIMAIAIQPDGRIMLGGGFTTLGGTNVNHVGRLYADGSLDPTIFPDANDGVMAIVIQPDGNMVLGGYFTTLGGQLRNNIGRVHPDGSLDTNFNPDASSNVNALLLQPDGKMLLGGNFTSISGQTRNYIGRIHSDGSIDTTLNPGANNYVNTIAVQPNGKILVGGGFTTLGGQSRNYFGRLNPDGSLDTVFNPGTNNIVSAIALHNDSKMVVGGFFTTVGGQSRSGIARLTSDGSLDTTFNPGNGIGSGGINAIAIQPDGKILVGGTFTTLCGQPRNYIGRLNVDGSLDTSFNPGISNFSFVKTLAVQPNGKILVGGYFTAIGGYARSYIARLNADGSVDTPFNPGASGEVDAIGLQPDGKIVVGGYFTTLAGQSRIRIGRLNVDGSVDATFNSGSGADSSVVALAIQSNGKIVLGGQFVQLGGQIWKSVGRLNADGSLDTTFFNPGVNGPVNALALQSDGKVLLGGTFTTFNAQNRSCIGRQANSDTSVQDLTIDIVGGKVSWKRSGASPEIWRATFEQSTDGETWTTLGDGTHISGGWELATYSLPTTQVFYVRANGYATSGGNSGSTSLYESMRYYAPPAPSAATGTATSVTDSTAILNGSVNANSGNVSVVFEYGLTTSYGTSATVDQNPVTGNITIPVSATVSGLLPTSTYHYRVVATNGTTTVFGYDATFTTLSPPKVNLSVILAGSGVGTVHSTPLPDAPDISCTTGTCNQLYETGTPVTLTSNANSDSYLVGWSGCDQLLNGSCMLTMNSVKTITADFQFNWPVVIGIPWAGYNGSIQGAYDSLTAGTDIFRLKVRDYSEGLTCNKDVQLTLQGGCSADVSDCSGMSMLNGNLTISAGSVIIGNIMFK